MAKPTPASRRAALAAQREAELRALRRQKMIGVISGVLAALLFVIGGAAWWHQAHKPKPVTAGSQVAVPHATADGTGITESATPSGRPTLVIYEDYQCPWCKKAVDRFSPLEQQLVAQGKIGVEIHSITLLDTMLANDSSLRANYAASCADVVGHYKAYHDAVFAAQPAKEGTGYTDEQLRSTFASAAGITGDDLARFQTCYDQRQTKDAVDKVLAAAKADNRDASSPSYWVRNASGAMKEMDLKDWLTATPPDVNTFLKAIEGTV